MVKHLLSTLPKSDSEGKLSVNAFHSTARLIYFLKLYRGNFQMEKRKDNSPTQPPIPGAQPSQNHWHTAKADSAITSDRLDYRKAKAVSIPV